MSANQIMDDCGNCRHFQRGYRLQTFKVPSSCNRHFHTVMCDDPACDQHERAEDGASDMRDNSAPRSIKHPPYDHPGDVA